MSDETPPPWSASTAERPVEPGATDAPEEPSDVTEGAADDDRATDDERARPAAPLPPPAVWGPGHDGPGSPAGSVRPPDTTGTVDADSGSSSVSRPSLGLVLLAAIVGAVLGTAATLALTQLVPEQVAAPDVRTPVVEAPAAESNVAEVAYAVTPSVVRIDRIQLADGIPTEEGLGSGVIYRSDGYIITNNHVVEGADELQVTLHDEESYTAEVVGTDPLTDLAVLRIDETGLTAITVREDEVVIGETAVAIGSPFELTSSVTAGIVSGLERSLEVPIEDGFISIPNVIQTDAAINPGNSGGALVDGSGRLIGINTAILATMQQTGLPGGNIGIGFAISAPDAVNVAEILIEQGAVRHARLGIQGGSLTPRIAHELGVAEDVQRGVFVVEAAPGTAADEAGIQPDDVIVEADGQRVRAMDELTAIIRGHEAGDELALTIIRDGERIELVAVLGEWEQ